MKNLKFKLVADARLYVIKLFKKLGKRDFHYHNLGHTKRVVKAAKKIAKKNYLCKNDYILLLVSAWFHDIGFLEGKSQHEERGAERVEKFLILQRVEASLIPSFKEAILATRLPQTPTNLVEEILCDADLYHLGTAGFFKINKSLRKEFQLVHGISIDKKEWIAKDIKMLTAQTYFTEYSRKELDKRLKSNLKKLILKQKKLSKVKVESETASETIIP
jgi:predicted metal-dependent HD superfamily phosphohydrolase